MTTPYAACPTLDGGTGDWLHDATTRSWVEGPPMLATVLFTLRTSKGECPLDPTLGPDHAVAAKRLPDAARRWQAEVRAALARYVAAGQLTDLQVTADAEGKALSYEVTFLDPRWPSTRQSTGRLTIG